jgi:hypothetical protein
MRAWVDGHGPAPQYHDTASIPLSAPDRDGPAGTATRVLCIEDNPANIEVVFRFLKTRPGIRLPSVTRARLIDSFAAGQDHEADPAPRTVPAP